MSNENTPVERMKYYPDSTQKVLPLVYSDALSYLESMSRVVKKLNEVIDMCNGITTDAVEQSKQYTDEAVVGFYADVEKAVQSVNELKNDLDRQYSDYVKLVNAQLNVFKVDINKISDKVDVGLIGANEYANFAIKQNNNYLLNEVSKGLKDVRVVNYFTGGTVSVQDMFDYLAQFHLENAITYTQLANRKKTYNQLADLDVTFTQLALNGAGLVI